MARLTDMELAKAFVAKTTPTFAEIVSRLEEHTDLNPARRRDMISGLKRVAFAIGWRPEDCPADPVWLRPRIAKVKPAALDFSKKTWTNVMSNARAALEEFGIIERDRGSPLQLSPEWQRHWQAALATGDKNITIPLSRFVRFCSSMCIAPGAVSDDTARDFKRALELEEIRKDPDATLWQAIHAWNGAVDRVSGWPEIRLTKPVRHNRYALPVGDFPESFGWDLDAMCSALAKPVRRIGAKRRQPLSKQTIDHRRRQWLRFASALVRAGTPVEGIRSLRDLVEIDRVECGLDWLAENRHDGKASAGLHEMALGLCTLGRELAVDDHHLAQLREFASVLSGGSGDRRVRNKGLTPKNRERLRQFRDPARRDALLCLPAGLMNEARKGDHPVKAARLAEVAVAIAIELVAPIRLRNLAGLDLDRHFDRSVREQLYLTIPDYEVKNGAPLEFQLPDRVRVMLETFLGDYRPYLIARPCRWLFAREDATDHAHQTVLARRITERIDERLGLEMNVHLFRHLAAMLILERDPGAYDLVRRILGHAELSTTIDAYGAFESTSATRMLAEIIEEAHAEPSSRPLVRGRRRS